MNCPLPAGVWRLAEKRDDSCRLWLALSLVLVLAGALVPARGAEVAAPPLALRRVALLNFAPAEDSFAATRAAADFTALVQARLTATPDLEWVERQEHERVRREMELLGAGVTRGDSIRAGRGLRADLLVLGRLVATNRTEQALDLEIIELQRADLLASRRVSLPAAGLTDPSLGAVEAVAAGVRAALAEARAYLERTRGQKTVAPLFFQVPSFPGAGMPGDESLAVIPREFLAGLDELSARHGFRVLRFPRLAAAAPEADLVLSGLVETDLDAWQKLADIYLWGEARWLPTFRPNLPPLPPRLELTLRLWNGHGKPQEWRETVPAEPAGTSRVAAFPARRVHAVLEQLLAHAVTAMHAPPVGEPDPAAREEIVRGFLERETALLLSPGMLHPPPNVPLSVVRSAQALMARFERSRQFGNASFTSRSARMYEVACFLDPRNADAQEQLLRFTERLPPATTNALTTLLHRREAWGRYVERFGFQHSHCAGTPRRCLDILEPYLQPMEELHRIISVAAVIRPKVGRNGQAFGGDAVVKLLLTLPEPDFLRVKKEQDAEFAARLRRVVEYLKEGPLELTPTLLGQLSGRYQHWGADMPWHLAARIFVEDLPFAPAERLRLLRLLEPRLIPRCQPPGGTLTAAQLKRAFAAAGEPGGEQVWLDRLAPPPTKATTNTVANAPPRPAAPILSVPAPATVATNRAFVLPPLFQLALPALAVARCEPPVEVIHFPADQNITGVHQLALADDGTAWVLAEEPSNPVPPPTSNFHFSAPPPRIWTLSLWKLARGRTAELRVAEISKERLQGGFLLHGGGLWVGGPQLSRWRVADGQWTDFGLREGLPLTQVNAPVIAGGRLYLSGQAEIFGCDTVDGRSWRSEPRLWPGWGNSPKLFPAGRGLVAQGFGVRAIRDPVSGQWLELGARLPTDSSINLNSMTFCVAVDADAGAWVGDNAGLHHLDYATLRLSHWPVAGATLGLAPVSAAQFSSVFRGWLVQRMRRLAVFGPLEIRPAALPGAVTALASDGEFLWVACGPEVLVWHPATRRWAGRFHLPHTVRTLAVDAEHVWAGGSDYPRGVSGAPPGQPVLVRFSKAAVLGRPRDQWVLDADDEAAWRKCASGLDVRSQTVAAFLRDNAAAAVAQLAATPLARLDVEGLLLLGLGCDFLGLDDPARAQAAWDELARREPVALWAEVAADLAAAHTEQRAALARLGLDFFRRHDSDEDGRLSARERARAMQDAVFWTAQGEDAIRTNAEVERLKKIYDRDGDGQFNAAEVQELMSREPGLAGDYFHQIAETSLRSLDRNRDGKLSVDELSLAQRVQNLRPGLYNQPPPPGLPRDRRGF